MTKRHQTKRKVSLRLANDEVAVVGSIAIWQHLNEVYQVLAEMYPEEREAWLECAEWISTSLQEGMAGIEEESWDED